MTLPRRLIIGQAGLDETVGDVVDSVLVDHRFGMFPQIRIIEFGADAFHFGHCVPGFFRQVQVAEGGQ